MTRTVKISKTCITVDGQRCNVRYYTGPWVSGVPADLIKIRPRRYSFPASFREAFEIENNTDLMTDYFEKDTIRVLPSHPLYSAIKAVA